MTELRKLFKQYWQLALLAVVALILLTIVSATGGDGRQVGSSYSISANGYNAWYQMVLDRGIKIKRWQKAFPQLINSSEYADGITLLQVQPQLERLNITSQQQKWVRQGNTLVILGVTAPAIEIPFQTDVSSPQGQIRIETTRRFGANINSSELLRDADSQTILGDRSGSIITEINLGKGKVIVSTTPYLAANAYQDFQPNYELLTALVTKNRQQILVDEYIHGYIDRSPKSTIDPITGDVRADGRDGDALEYLINTPLIIVAINLILGLLVLIWQQNQRFGKITIPKTPEVDNGEAYIQALGGVLHQANTSEFVLEQIGKAEQLGWQQKLGLGKGRLVEPKILITAWEAQTKLPAEDLRFVLQLMSESQRISPKQLALWLKKIREIDRQLGI